MSWSNTDNPNIRGPADSTYVSLTEQWERDRFIDSYLKSRNYSVNDESRRIVANDLKACTLPAPILRTTLEVWLDRVYASRN